MKSNSNLFLAVLVVIGFLFFWNSFVVSRYAPKTSPTGSTPQRPESALTPPPMLSAPSPTTKRTAPATDVELTAGNDHVHLESHGARVASWRLLEKDHWVELVYTGKESKRLPLETFSDLEFGLESSDKNKAVYVATLPSGLVLRKTLTLSQSSPLHTITLEFSNPTNQSLQQSSEFGWGNGLNKRAINVETGKVREDNDPRGEMRAVGLAEKLRQWKGGVIFGKNVDIISEGNFKWAGVDNHHFLAVLIPSEGFIPRVHATASKKMAPSVGIPLEVSLKPKETKTFSYFLYVGPKRASELREAGHSLDQSVSFGTFGIISKTLLGALEFFYRHTGNYGWAIIILTICIQIVVFPLTKRSLEHSVKMKTLQPQLKVLQEQFKSDPKRLQIETMNLYKKHGMHFLGLEGCFPILLQIPVFFAFYAALNGAYELRGAPWIFWIKDLAGPDPYHVLPILMGIGMFLQQKLTTVPTDPAQARMAMMMPLIFVFMFFKMPAGLVLYWTINSLCTIVNQRFLVFRQSHSAAAPS